MDINLVIKLQTNLQTLKPFFIYADLQGSLYAVLLYFNFDLDSFLHILNWNPFEMIVFALLQVLELLLLPLLKWQDLYQSYIMNFVVSFAFSFGPFLATGLPFFIIATEDEDIWISALLYAVGGLAIFGSFLLLFGLAVWLLIGTDLGATAMSGDLRTREPEGTVNFLKDALWKLLSVSPYAPFYCLLGGIVLWAAKDLVLEAIAQFFVDSGVINYEEPYVALTTANLGFIASFMIFTLLLKVAHAPTSIDESYNFQEAFRLPELTLDLPSSTGQYIGIILFLVIKSASVLVLVAEAVLDYLHPVEKVDSDDGLWD